MLTAAAGAGEHGPGNQLGSDWNSGRINATPFIDPQIVPGRRRRGQRQLNLAVRVYQGQVTIETPHPQLQR